MRNALRPRAEAEASSDAPDIAATEERIETAREAAASVRSRLASADERLRETAEAEARARAPLDQAEQETRRLTAEAKALTNLLRPRESDLWPPLIDSLKVQPGYEAALAAALGDELNAPLDEAAPHHWRHLGELESPPALPAGTALAAFVDAPPALSRRLALTGVVSVEDGKRFAEGSAARPAARLAARRCVALGRLLGVRRCAEPGGRPARTAQSARGAGRTGESGEAPARSGACRACGGAGGTRCGHRGRARRVARIARARGRSARGAGRVRRWPRARSPSARQRLASIEAEIKSLEQAGENARRTVQAATEALNALADARALAERLEQARSAAIEARSHTGEARSALDALRSEVSMRNQRLSAVKDDGARWTQRRDAAARQIAALEGRVAAMAQELAAFEAKPAEILQRRVACSMRSAARTARKIAADARAEAENRLVEWRPGRETCRSRALRSARRTRGRRSALRVGRSNGWRNCAAAFATNWPRLPTSSKSAPRSRTAPSFRRSSRPRSASRS